MTTLLELIGTIIFGLALMFVLNYAYGRDRGISIIGSALVVIGTAFLVWGVADREGYPLAFGAFMIVGAIMTFVRRKAFLEQPPRNPFSRRSNSA